MFLAGPVAAYAQGAGTPSAGGDGLQQTVSRNYGTDATAPVVDQALSGTPGATPDMTTASPAASPVAGGGLQTASGFIFQYQTADQASAAFASSSEQIITAFNDQFKALTGITVEPTTIDGVGNAANAWSGSGTLGGATLTVFAIVAQQDTYLYFTILVAKDSDAQDSTVAFMNALIANPAGEGQGDFKKDGTSSGGLWDKFPAAGDAVLPGLRPINDMQL